MNSKTKTSSGALRSRRQFMVDTGALAGGGLALGMNLSLLSGSAQAQSVATGAAEVNAWVVVKPDDTVVIRIARSEMGQGTLTGLAQLVAEELDCKWSKVKTEYIAPEINFAKNRAWGDMSTGGSRGIRTSVPYVQKGGAAAKAMLIAAEARTSVGSSPARSQTRWKKLLLPNSQPRACVAWRRLVRVGRRGWRRGLLPCRP